MAEKKRVDRVELGPMDRAKAVDIYAREFVCTAAGKVQGNLDAETAEVRGACKVEGDVKATILKVSGSLKIEGNVTSELVRSKGSLKVEGDVAADNLRVSGATKIEGDITSSVEIFVEGVLKCESGIVAEKLTLFGVLDVEGTVKAKTFKAELGGKSSIHTLEAEKIYVKIGRSSNRPELIVKNITGDDIYLEATVAEKVDGRKVVIGPGCTILSVKADVLEIHKDSKVSKRL